MANPDLEKFMSRLFLNEEQAINEFLTAVTADDQKKLLPIFFYVRMSFKTTKQNDKLGILFVKSIAIQLNKEDFNRTITGGLLALITLHAPIELPKIIRKICEKENHAAALMETLIALRMVINDTCGLL